MGGRDIRFRIYHRLRPPRTLLQDKEEKKKKKKRKKWRRKGKRINRRRGRINSLDTQCLPHHRPSTKKGGKKKKGRGRIKKREGEHQVKSAVLVPELKILTLRKEKKEGEKKERKKEKSVRDSQAHGRECADPSRSPVLSVSQEKKGGKKKEKKKRERKVEETHLPAALDITIRS